MKKSHRPGKKARFKIFIFLLDKFPPLMLVVINARSSFERFFSHVCLSLILNTIPKLKSCYPRLDSDQKSIELSRVNTVSTLRLAPHRINSVSMANHIFNILSKSVKATTFGALLCIHCVAVSIQVGGIATKV